MHIETRENRIQKLLGWFMGPPVTLAANQLDHQ